MELETSVAEVAFHRRRFLRNVRHAKLQGRQTFDYADFVADFRGRFHYLDAEEKQSCLQAKPISAFYQASRMAAGKLVFAEA